MSLRVTHIPPSSEVAAKAILSKVRMRIYLCGTAMVPVADNGWCHIHDDDACVNMYIEYRETMRAVEQGL